jgi:hypothetical protein
MKFRRLVQDFSNPVFHVIDLRIQLLKKYIAILSRPQGNT